MPHSLLLHLFMSPQATQQRKVHWPPQSDKMWMRGPLMCFSESNACSHPSCTPRACGLTRPVHCSAVLAGVCQTPRPRWKNDAVVELLSQSPPPFYWWLRWHRPTSPPPHTHFWFNPVALNHQSISKVNSCLSCTVKCKLWGGKGAKTIPCGAPVTALKAPRCGLLGK